MALVPMALVPMALVPMALVPMALVPAALGPAALGRVGLADTQASTGSARILWSPAPRRRQSPDLQRDLAL
jgi:hypothetical protein